MCLCLGMAALLITMSTRPKVSAQISTVDSTTSRFARSPQISRTSAPRVFALFGAGRQKVASARHQDQSSRAHGKIESDLPADTGRRAGYDNRFVVEVNRNHLLQPRNQPSYCFISSFSVPIWRFSGEDSPASQRLRASIHPTIILPKFAGL